MIEKYKENILRFYATISKPHNKDYLLWYITTNLWAKELSDKYSKSFEFICALISICSINKRWSENQKIVIEYLEEGNINGLGIVKRKIEQLENCNLEYACVMDILNGQKLQDFYTSISRPYNTYCVAVDRYVARYSGLEKKLTNKRYREIKQAHLELGKELGIIPSRLQALLWCEYRGNHQ